MTAELVYLGHYNPISRIIKRQRSTDPAPVPIPLLEMATITRMTLTLGTKLIDSDNGDTDPIQWNKAGYEAGEFRMDLGGETIDPGAYQNAWLVVYYPEKPTGTVWGSFPVYVIAEVEGPVGP
jgi:hypothetical protein